MSPQPLLRSLLPLLLGLALAACGEPPLAVELPSRTDGQQVADLAGILDSEAMQSQLADYEADIVVLTYTTPDANCGEAFRAGKAFVTAWDADVALVAVARPGDFADTDGERCVGLQPRDDFAVGRGTREDITEQRWPPLIAENRWDEVFAVGGEALAEVLGEQP